MIIGTGIDLTEIQRIQTIYQKQPTFISKVLTPAEIKQFQNLPNAKQPSYIAGRFAVKEAFSKALGTGIGETVSFLDIETLTQKNGQPLTTSQVYDGKIHVSIAHTTTLVIAQIVLERL